MRSTTITSAVTSNTTCPGASFRHQARRKESDGKTVESQYAVNISIFFYNDGLSIILSVCMTFRSSSVFMYQPSLCLYSCMWIRLFLSLLFVFLSLVTLQENRLCQCVSGKVLTYQLQNHISLLAFLSDCDTSNLYLFVTETKQKQKH